MIIRMVGEKLGEMEDELIYNTEEVKHRNLKAFVCGFLEGASDTVFVYGVITLASFTALALSGKQLDIQIKSKK